MKPKVLFVLAGMTVLMIVASCRESTNSPQPSSPTNSSQPPTDVQARTDKAVGEAEKRVGHTPFKDWINHSPFRETMRRFWVDMGLIVANSARPKTANVETLDAAAADIERRSRRIADFWKAIRDRAAAGYTKAKANDWDGADLEIDELHHECGNCHYEYWSQAARGYIPRTLNKWQENGTPFGVKEDWGNGVRNAPQFVRDSMNKLAKNMGSSFDAIRAEDIGEFKDTSKVLHNMADKQYKIFDSIARSAKLIQNAADSGDLSRVGEHYNQIAARCITCHAQAAPTTSINPLPYSDARD